MWSDITHEWFSNEQLAEKVYQDHWSSKSLWEVKGADLQFIMSENCWGDLTNGAATLKAEGKKINVKNFYVL